MNAAYLDMIEGILFNEEKIEELRTEPQYKGEEISLEGIGKDELISLLENCAYFCFEDTSICITKRLTDEELAKRIEERESNQEYRLSKMKKWCKDPEAKRQIDRKLISLGRADIIDLIDSAS